MERPCFSISTVMVWVILTFTGGFLAGSLFERVKCDECCRFRVEIGSCDAGK